MAHMAIFNSFLYVYQRVIVNTPQKPWCSRGFTHNRDHLGYLGEFKKMWMGLIHNQQSMTRIN